nr:charged multivesicular body protein 7 [Tanacetum cinerariifolium]
MDMIDQRHDKSKLSALACLKSGNKAKALRHAQELKLSLESREKCDMLLRRVEEVLRAIAEDSKEPSMKMLLDITYAKETLEIWDYTSYPLLN